MLTPGTKLTYLPPLNIFLKASDVQLSALGICFFAFVPLPWWLKQYRIHLHAGDVQETQVQSLGQEDPLEQ